MRHCWSVVSREPGAEAKWDKGGVSCFRNFSLEHEWGHGPSSVEPECLWGSTMLSTHVLAELCT